MHNNGLVELQGDREGVTHPQPGDTVHLLSTIGIEGHSAGKWQFRL